MIAKLYVEFEFWTLTYIYDIEIQFKCFETIKNVRLMSKFYVDAQNNII